MRTGAGRVRGRPCRRKLDSRRARATLVFTAIALKFRRAARCSNVSRIGPRPVRNTASNGKSAFAPAASSAFTRRASAERVSVRSARSRASSNNRNPRRASSSSGTPRSAARPAELGLGGEFAPEGGRRGRRRRGERRRRPVVDDHRLHAVFTREPIPHRLRHRQVPVGAFRPPPLATCERLDRAMAVAHFHRGNSVRKVVPVDHEARAAQARGEPRYRERRAPLEDSRRGSRRAWRCASGSRTDGPPAPPRRATPIPRRTCGRRLSRVPQTPDRSGDDSESARSPTPPAPSASLRAR